MYWSVFFEFKSHLIIVSMWFNNRLKMVFWWFDDNNSKVAQRYIDCGLMKNTRISCYPLTAPTPFLYNPFSLHKSSPFFR